MHLVRRQPKPRKRPCSKWEHGRFRYLSELLSLDAVALLVVEVEPWHGVDGGGWNKRLSAVLYRTAGGLYWREGGMPEPLPLASGDDALSVARTHLAELVEWITGFRGTKKRPSVLVVERRGFEAFAAGLSEASRNWLERARAMAQTEVAPGTFRWDLWEWG